MKLYSKFRNSSLDISPLGIFCGEDVSDSVYTPNGAKVVAWANDRSVHFCQIEGFGDLVFSVDPTAPPGDCVQPVAKTLQDFIGLLTVCRNAKLISHAYRWSCALFNHHLRGIRPTVKMNSVIRALENTYRSDSISDPYSYIRALQNSFDYRGIPLHPDYFEWCPIRPGAPKWDVGFNTAFADYCDKNKVGTEHTIAKTADWKGEKWCIPSVYLCENGIVADSYLEVPLEQIEAYRTKWAHRPTDSLSIEEQMCRKLDDPLDLDVMGSLLVNDKPAPLRKSFTAVWNPLEENTWQARRTLEHYGLDREKGYLLRREAFLRKGKNPPIRTIELTLQAAPVSVPGQRFTAPKNGDSLTFTHPETGTEHRLTVISLTREALDPNFLSNHPCCYTRLTFTLDPQISSELLRIVDCDPGDRWNGSSEDISAAFPAGKIHSAGHFAISSLRYTPAEQITWRMVFLRKLRRDISIRLLP